MKKNKIYSAAMLLCLAIGLLGCGKFSLQKNDDTASTGAGANLKDKTIWQFVSENNFHATDLTGIGLYGKAVQLAGLQDMLSADGNYTVIIPSDKAITAFIQTIGYTNINDVPPFVLKNLLLDNIISSRVHSFDLQINQVAGYTTVNSDSLFLSRESTTTDQYVLYVNKSTTVSSPSTGVRSQNLELKNGVAHVVDIFTYYKPKTSNPDAVDPTKVSFISDTLFVQKDSYVTYGTSAALNFNTTTELYTKLNSAAASTRRTYTQFAVRNPIFSGRIGSAKMVLYVFRVDGAATVNLLLDEYKDWNETTLTANNAPIPSTTPIGSFAVTTGSINKYFATDITSTYTTALSQGKTFINIGVHTFDNQLVGFRPKEFNNGQFKAYMVLTSPPVTLLKNAVVNPVIVDAKLGSKGISLNELKLEGTADKNIIYSITALPANGFILVNGIPLTINATFSQEQIAKGAVKYVYTGTAATATDSFSVEAKDFQGGYYPNILTLNVQVK